MDTKIIDVIFGYGRILGLTPHSKRLSEKLICLQKLYSFLIFTLTYTFGILLICIEINSQLFYVVLRCIILEMLLCRYQHQNYLVLQAGSRAHFHNLFKILTKIKRNLLLMKTAIDLFNDIFGWTTLLNIFSISVRTLIHIDIFITKGSSLYLTTNTASILNTLYQITLLLIIWSGVLANVLLCDSVVQKHAQLLVLVSELETNYQGVSSVNQQLNSLLNTIEHLRPKFEAARFFSVDKTILFTVLYSIVTFLLVIIQFKLNL
ncbi:hypothetical protein MTP99_004240 [Tenebrio molitor]|nr:hypothetical protein MTP99_004240 [Tenebrio molitor]